MSRLNYIDPQTATGEAAELLATVKAKMGGVPNLLKVMANAPSVLKTYLSFGETIHTGRFNAKTREALALTIAAANGCDYCASAHSAIAGSLKVDSNEITLNLQGRSNDPKIEALLVFAQRVVQTRGFVTDADLTEVRAAGYDDADILEVIGQVVANTLTNYVNHVAQTDIDFPKVTVGHQQAA